MKTFDCPHCKWGIVSVYEAYYANEDTTKFIVKCHNLQCKSILQINVDKNLDKQ